MSTDKGYIKLYRDIRDHWLWDSKPYDPARAWIDLLMMANHEDKPLLFDGTKLTVYRGMIITSIRKLADRWGWSTKKVSRFLNLLENEIMIRQERNRKRTALSIVNYDDYQTSGNTKRNTEETPKKHRRNTEETKQYTKKNEEDTKEENIAPSGADLTDQYPDEEGWYDA